MNPSSLVNIPENISTSLVQPHIIGQGPTFELLGPESVGAVNAVVMAKHLLA